MNESGETAAGPLDVHDVLAVMADQMAAIAWTKLGLQPDFQTGRIETDFEQAKIAIDVTSQLAAIIEPKLEEDDRRRIHALIRDLRLNYVQKTQGSGS